MALCVSSAAAQSEERLPLVREGARWVFTEQYTCIYPEEMAQPSVDMGRLYRYEMRGDTVIDGVTYTKCYRISMSRDTLWGTMGYELQRGLTCSEVTPAACLRQDGRKVFYRMPGGTSEWPLYDFEGPDVLPGYHMTFNHCTPVDVAGYECERYELYQGRHISYFIEGIGTVSEQEGELLYPNLSLVPGLEYTLHGMSHVEDADGDVVFMGPNYGKYDDETDLRGDVNGDGLVDVEDLNAVINELFRFSAIQSNTVFGEDEEIFWVVPFKRAADLNNDGYIDIADVNAVVNHIVRKH